MAEKPNKTHRFPIQAGRWRRAWHLLLALVGWLLFGYWWWLVWHRVSRQEVVYTGVFIAVTTVVSVALTGLWALYNKRLARTKTPRRHVREVRESYERDTLGRRVTFTGGESTARQARVLRIAMDEKTKVYHSDA